MSGQHSMGFISIIFCIIENILFSATFATGDIIVPPKLSNKTTLAMLAPTMLPHDKRQTTDILGSIMERSTAKPLDLIVPPTIYPKDSGPQAQPESVRLNLMVPPTISSAEKGTDSNSGHLSSQVTGVLNSKPRVVCYADQPIEQDVPCSGNLSIDSSVQHMQGLLKALGGSDTIHLNTAAPTPFADVNSDNKNILLKPEEQENLNKIILEISLRLNQRVLASRSRPSIKELQTLANEIIAVTNNVFQLLFSVYTEKFVTSSFTSLNNHKCDVESEGWQHCLVSNSSSEDFILSISYLSGTIEKMRHFYQNFLDISKTPAEFKSFIKTVNNEVDVDAAKSVVSNLKSAISNLQTMYNLMDVAVSNVKNDDRPTTLKDSQSQINGTKQIFTALKGYVKSSQLLESLGSDANQSFSSMEISEIMTNDTEKTLLGVTKFLHSRTNTLEQLLEEYSVEVSDHKRNIDKLNNIRWNIGRKRRDIIGTNDMTCQSQGERIGGGNLLNLCSTCVQTSVLSNEFFPRYLTEKICQPDSLSAPLGPRTTQQGCLYQPGYGGTSVASGTCREQYFHINILKRVPGKCMKIHLDGKEVVTDLWELTMHPLRVGCECAVDENSRFAQYVNKH